MNEVIFVGASKGGVGKSIVSMSVIDYLKNFAGRKVLLIDADPSNPDVFKTYKNEVDKAILVSISEAADTSGWVHILETIENNPDHTIVISTGSGVSQSIGANANFLNPIKEFYKRRLLTFWVINQQADVLQYLDAYMKKVTKSEFYIFKNLYFGSQQNFILYDNSSIQKQIENYNGRDFCFPLLASRVSNRQNATRLTFKNASLNFPISHRVELDRWRKICTNIYDTIFKIEAA